MGEGGGGGGGRGTAGYRLAGACIRLVLILEVMAYMGRLREERVTFLGFKYKKR